MIYNLNKKNYILHYILILYNYKEINGAKK